MNYENHKDTVRELIIPGTAKAKMIGDKTMSRGETGNADSALAARKNGYRNHEGGKCHEGDPLNEVRLFLIRKMLWSCAVVMKEARTISCGLCMV